jgi:hypothetical protein
MMNHVSYTRQYVKLTLGNLFREAGGLPFRACDAIPRARHDDDRHGQLLVSAAKRDRRGDHQSALCRARP